MSRESRGGRGGLGGRGGRRARGGGGVCVVGGRAACPALAVGVTRRCDAAVRVLSDG